MDAICVGLYGDGSRKARLRAEYICCEHYESCSAYKKNQCFGITTIFGARCKFANVVRVDGGLKSSKAYSKVWAEAKSHPNYAKLSYPTNSKVARIESGIILFLPYVCIEIENGKVNCDDLVFGSRCTYIENEYITTANIKKICNFRINSYFGRNVDEIYKNRVIPRFLRELKQLLPEFYNKLINENPELEKENINFVGETARLTTINRKTKFVDALKNEYVFEDDYIVCKNYKSSFLPFWAKSAEIKIKLDDSMVVKITDNSQVTENTEFE